MTIDESPAPTRPYARGRDRRDELVEAAARVFAREGYERARLTTLAAAAGMTDAGLLHHFSSKAELYLAALESRKERGEGLGIMDTDLDLRQTVEVLIAYVEGAMNTPDIVRFRAVVSGEALLPDNPAAERLQGEYAGMFPVWTAKVERAQRKGDVRADLNPRSLVLELVALHEGLRHQAVAHPGTFDYPATFRDAAHRWLESLRPA
jgi:AcrR family transcriptional regulator